MADQPTPMAYPPDFEEAWSLYPKRPANSKRAAFIQWQKRLKEGATPEQMLAGTRAYASYCDQEKITGTNLVKMAQTFFGPGWHFDADFGTEEKQEQNRGEGDLLSFYGTQTFI